MVRGKKNLDFEPQALCCAYISSSNNSSGNLYIDATVYWLCINVDVSQLLVRTNLVCIDHVLVCVPQK